MQLFTPPPLWTSQILPAEQTKQPHLTAAQEPKSKNSTASSLGSDAWVLVRRRNLR